MVRIITDLNALIGFHPVKMKGRYAVYQRDDFNRNERISALFKALGLTTITFCLALKTQNVRELWTKALFGRIRVYAPKDLIKKDFRVSIYNSSRIKPDFKLTNLPHALPFFGAQPLHETLRAVFAFKNQGLVGTHGMNHFKSDFLLNFRSRNKLHIQTLNFVKSYLKTLDIKDKNLIAPSIDITDVSKVRIKMKELLNFYQDNLDLINNRPKALFIPMATQIPNPHALTVVIEPDPDDERSAKITLIDSFGSKSYERVLDEVQLGIRDFYLLSSTTVKSNKVQQQSDAKTCGIHQVENNSMRSKNLWLIINCLLVPCMI